MGFTSPDGALGDPKWPCGEDISNVTCGGRHAREAYEATIEAYPSLKDSVRGRQAQLPLLNGRPSQ